MSNFRARFLFHCRHQSKTLASLNWRETRAIASRAEGGVGGVDKEREGFGLITGAVATWARRGEFSSDLGPHKLHCAAAGRTDGGTVRRLIFSTTSGFVRA